MRSLVPVTWLVLALALDVSRASQVSYDDVSFEELMRPVRDGHATLVIVTLATPEHAKRAYRVPGGRGKRCAAYDFIEYRGNVDRVVRAARSSPALAAKKPIAIVPANVPELVDLSHRECVEGLRKSPIWGRFPGADPSAGAQLMVVLRWHERYRWLEQISGAWLPMADLQRVEAFLASPSSP